MNHNLLLQTRLNYCMSPVMNELSYQISVLVPRECMHERYKTV